MRSKKKPGIDSPASRKQTAFRYSCLAVPVNPNEIARHCWEFRPSDESHQLAHVNPKNEEFRKAEPSGCAWAFLPFMSWVVFDTKILPTKQLPSVSPLVHCGRTLNQYSPGPRNMVGNFTSTVYSFRPMKLFPVAATEMVPLPEATLVPPSP